MQWMKLIMNAEQANEIGAAVQSWLLVQVVLMAW